MTDGSELDAGQLHQSESGDVYYNAGGGVPEYIKNAVSGLVNGTTFQVLAKLSDTDYDYSWDFRSFFDNSYANGKLSYEQTWVSNGEFIAVANTDTTEPAFPVEVGLPDPTYPTFPPFLDATHTGQVRSGHTYTFTEPGAIEKVEVWVSDVTAATRYALVTVWGPNGANPTTLRRPLDGSTLTANQWNIVTVGTIYAAQGSELLLYLEVDDFSSSTTTTGDWNYDGRQNTAVPATGAWNHTNDQTIVRIHKTDFNSGDRAAELALMGVGTEIVFKDNAGDPNGFTYIVQAAPVDQGTYYEYTVTLIGSSGTLVEDSVTGMTAETPVPNPAEYSYETDKWLNDSPTWATVASSLVFDGVPQAADSNIGYGINIEFQQLAQSAEWDLIPVGGGTGGEGGDFTPDLFTGPGTSGYVPDPGTANNYFLRDDGSWQPAAGGGVATFLDLTDTPSSYAGQALKHVQVNVTANGLDFVDAPTVITDHGGLTGLLDDDHTQYHTDARGDARYPQLTDYNSHVGDATIHYADALADGKTYGRNNNAWVEVTGGGGVTDHGALTGLADDDHTQYHTNARGDARYPQLTDYNAHVINTGIHFLDAAADGTIYGRQNNTWVEVSVGTLDHGGLSGLADDDHTQYHTDARGDLRYPQLSDYNTHVGDATVHFADAASDGTMYGRINNGWSAIVDTNTDTFIELTDTPAAYTVQAGKRATVNATEDGIVFDDRGTKVFFKATQPTDGESQAGDLWLVSL
jgi:hypothetical protein